MKFIIISLFISLSFAQKDLKLTFLVNHGWIIENSETKIVIDGYFKKHYEQIDSYTSEELDILKGNYYPFKEIDIQLITHEHLDHFNLDLSASFLSLNKTNKLISTTAVVSQFKSGNVLGRTGNLGEYIDFNHKNVKIRQIFLKHMGKNNSAIENTGFIITISGKTFLHVGDADLTEENYAPYNLIDLNIDYLIIPFWQVSKPEHISVIEKTIKPKYIIPSHFNVNFLNQVPSDIKNGIYFSKHFESKMLN